MAKFGIGNSVRRVEDPRLLTGKGRYTDDTKLSTPAARLYVLRSPMPMPTSSRIDTAAAKKAPSVLLVLTGEDVKKAASATCPAWSRSRTAMAPRGETSRPMLAWAACAMSAMRWRWWWPRRWSRPRTRPS